MLSTPTISAAPAIPWSRGALWQIGVPLLLFAVLWVDLIRQLSYTWGTNEQYAYGWFVPFLAIALFWKRWTTRPAPPTSDPHPISSVIGPPPSVLRHLPAALRGLVFLLALTLLPVRVVHEINPDWPLANWVLALLVVSLSIYAVFLAGGWTWVRHFAFPVCFILIAIRWPYRIEHSLTQSLMQVVASLTVEILGWFNIPALQRGNLIELTTGLLGVDEACSGIRSFQSTLMAALFMGELYRLRLPIRLLLAGAGLTAAFLFNVGRTLILTWQANAHGLSAIEKWHDPAGLTIAVACFAVLWLLAILMRDKWGHSSAQRSELGLPKDVAPPNPSSGLRSYLIMIGCWAIFCFAATEIWYRSHDTEQRRFSAWGITPPTNSPSFRSIPLTSAVSNLLKSDISLAGKWRENDGAEWALYFFRWDPHSMQSAISARLHRPEVCLAGMGLRQTSKSPLDHFAAGPLQIPFHKYTFDANGQQFYVFFSLWQDGEEQSGMRMIDQRDRIRWVLAGRRRLGQQTLEIICSGYPDLGTAEQAVRNRLPRLVRIAGQEMSADGLRL